MSGNKNQRIDVIRSLIKNPKKLPPEEFLQILHESATMSACNIWLKAHYENHDGIQAWANTLDKVFWLIDSMEKQQPTAAEDKTKSLGWDYDANTLESPPTADA